MITSKDNSAIKYIKALSQKKYRDECGEYIVEGIKMCKEAFEFCDIKTIVICKELLENEYDDILKAINKYKKQDSLIEVSNAVFTTISDTKTPQGVICVVKKEMPKKLKNVDTIFVLDDVQDPGNVGTIIRTLDSAGYSSLILSKGSADPYNLKVVRSTMGAIFRLQIEQLNLELFERIESLKKEGYKICITSLDAKEYYSNLDFNQKLVIVIGNESKGVSKEIQDLADIKIKIPMIGKTESLNAAVATSIIAYEKVRQTLTKEK